MANGWEREQQRLAQLVVSADDVSWSLSPGSPRALQRVGGLDISFQQAQQHGDEARPAGQGYVEHAVAALVVLSFPDLCVVYEDYEPVDLTVPYIPGYLGFRECPSYARLLDRVRATEHNPQVLLVDGCGMLHPRRCGSACQVGVMCGYPSVGVAKDLLVVEGLSMHEVKEALAQLATAGTQQQLPKGATEQAEANTGGPEACDEQGGRIARPGSAAAPQVPEPASCAADAGLAAPPVLKQQDDGGPTTSASDATASLPSEHRNHHHSTNATTQSPAAAATAIPAATTAPPPPATASTSAPAPRQRASGPAAPTTRTQPTPERVLPLQGSSGDILGAALCLRSSKPIFVSVGHRLSLDSCVALVRACSRYRIPEPIRQADLRSREWLRRHAGTAPSPAADPPEPVAPERGQGKGSATAPRAGG